MRVLISSGHTLIAQSLATMLQNVQSDEPVETLLCAAPHAVERATLWNPDLILVEAIADFAGGVVQIGKLREIFPDTRLVLLSTEDDEASIFEAISAGADGYLTRDTSAEMLAATLRGVARGELGLSRAAALRVIQQLCRTVRARSTQMPADVQSKLTQREREIFELVRRGMRSRDIAEHLCIAEGTVYKHVQNILEKLRVHSRTQAVLIADMDHPDEELPAHLFESRARKTSRSRARPIPLPSSQRAT